MTEAYLIQRDEREQHAHGNEQPALLRPRDTRRAKTNDGELRQQDNDIAMPTVRAQYFADEPTMLNGKVAGGDIKRHHRDERRPAQLRQDDKRRQDTAGVKREVSEYDQRHAQGGEKRP